MSFEEWWVEFWKTNGLPGIMNLAFKEIAEKAWNAALKHDSQQKPEKSFKLNEGF